MSIIKAVQRRRGLASVVAAGILLAGALGPAGAAPPEQKAAGPAIRLVAAAPAVELRRDSLPDLPGWFSLDVGARMLAGERGFELRVRRASYADPITVLQVSRTGRGERTTDLPAGLVRDFSGLPGFFHLQLTKAGRTVLDLAEDFCPNSRTAVRADPQAPDSSPYPYVCSGNPFSVGNLWGIQRGWATPAVSMNGAPLVSLAAGTYTATVTVTERYRLLWQIPPEQATVTVAVTVVGDEPAGPPTAQAHTHAHAQAQQGGPEHGEHVAADHREHVAAAHRPLAIDPLLNGRRERPAGAAQAPLSARPDLRAVPAFGIGVDADVATGKDFLTFAATVWNAGPAPLVVDGFRREGEDVMDTFQYFYDAQGRQVGYAPAGSMVWDDRDGHSHWHLNGFAAYSLLGSDRTEAARSQKEGFCLANTDPIDHFVAGANWQPGNTDLRSACGNYTSLSSRQALHVGSGDTYVQYLPGQSFDITDLPNGTYAIQVAANAGGRIYETNRRNNTSTRPISLGGVPGARTVTVPPVGVVEAP